MLVPRITHRGYTGARAAFPSSVQLFRILAALPVHYGLAGLLQGLLRIPFQDPFSVLIKLLRCLTEKEDVLKTVCEHFQTTLSGESIPVCPDSYR